MKKKILFAYPEMMVGGSTTSLLSLLNSIDYDKFDVDLVLYKNQGVLLEFIPDKVNLLPQASIYGEGLFNDIKKIIRSTLNGSIMYSLFNEMKYKKKIGLNEQTLAYAQSKISRDLSLNYDVAIGFLENWSNAFILNNVNAQKKIIWIHVDYLDAGLIPKIDYDAFNNADNIINVSSECLNNFKNAFPDYSEKSLVLENISSVKHIVKMSNHPVDQLIHSSFEGISFITVCRLSIYHKGLDSAIQAFKRIKEEGHSFKWVIIGDGPDRKEVEELIEQANLKTNIILTGNKINPYPYFKQCQVFLMPSRYEGKPMAVTEAQILGLPVIATEYASAKEQIINDFNGILVSNDEEGIYKGIKVIFESKLNIKKYSRNINVKRIEEVNNDVLNKFYDTLQ
ncbi:glycosyltransferase [Exiguobacterium mexicanum]|uniref:glycosyltransferase n=1 Tax=Exiguobacterium mexicanum TaxID=340146 RepID=UPI0037BED1B3